MGLELIARGGEKPVELNIKWQPANNRRNATEQTKRFVLLAILAHVVDAFDALLREYAELEWTSFDQELKKILRKSVTKPNKESYSIRERAEALFKYLSLDESDGLDILELMVRWRNSLVHPRRARRILPDGTFERLLRSKADLAERYAGIDIERTIDSFSKEGWPTLKEATTMVAVCQNLARTADEALIRLEASTPARMKEIAIIELAVVFRQSEARWTAIAGRSLQKRYKVLLAYLHEAGVTAGQVGISAPLDDDVLDGLARLTRSQLEEVLSKSGKYTRPNTNTS